MLYMDFLFTLAIFIVILFLYIYIVNQYKKSEDLDIYEMDFSDNNHLQEVCDIRQPIIFQFQNIHPKLFSEMNVAKISKYHSYDVHVKDAHDYYNHDRAEHTQVESVNLSFNSTIKLLENDKACHFFSEKNDEFLEESGLLKTMQSMDDFLKPAFTLSSHHDLTFGSPGAVTPLRYHTNYRQFICVTSGNIRVKMAPWKCSKYLHPIKDYDNYEFRSPVHPISPKTEYMMDFEKTKFLEFEVNEGYVLYIPPYWWYSIQYSHTPGTFVCEVTYNTIMNCISNIPDLGLYWLQQQNITKKIAKMPKPEALPVQNVPTPNDANVETISAGLPITQSDEINVTKFQDSAAATQDESILESQLPVISSVQEYELLNNPVHNSKIVTHEEMTKSIVDNPVINVVRVIPGNDVIIHNI